MTFYSHNGVFREDSATTILKVVFNSSAPSSSGMSYSPLAINFTKNQPVWSAGNPEAGLLHVYIVKKYTNVYGKNIFIYDNFNHVHLL